MLQDEPATLRADPARTNPEPKAPEPWSEPLVTALLVLADGTVLEGFGIGQTGAADGEVCFNTAMTGYQEILTDPSYAGQIVTFTFPHIGNVGTNDEDLESLDQAPASGVRGAVIASAVTKPSNWRSSSHLDGWLKARGIVGITGIDTRALTALIRDRGMPNAVIANDPEGKFDREALKARAAALAPMEGLDLVPPVTSRETTAWTETVWAVKGGYGSRAPGQGLKVVAIDYGVKRNILRLLAEAGCDVTVVPATTTAEDIMALKPDGVFLSNGPGDPAATGIRRAGDPQAARRAGADLRHLPRPPADGPRARRAHGEDGPGPSRREPPGEGPHHRQGRDRLDEPRLRGRSHEPARDRGRDPRLSVRRLELRSLPHRPPGLLGAAPPGSLSGPA